MCTLSQNGYGAIQCRSNPPVHAVSGESFGLANSPTQKGNGGWVYIISLVLVSARSQSSSSMRYHAQPVCLLRQTRPVLATQYLAKPDGGRGWRVLLYFSQTTRHARAHTHTHTELSVQYRWEAGTTQVLNINNQMCVCMLVMTVLKWASEAPCKYRNKRFTRSVA